MVEDFEVLEDRVEAPLDLNLAALPPMLQEMFRHNGRFLDAEQISCFFGSEQDVRETLEGLGLVFGSVHHAEAFSRVVELWEDAQALAARRVRAKVARKASVPSGP